MINNGNLNNYIGGDHNIDTWTPVNGWSNGMQIPTNKPIDDENQHITFTGRGQINFKQVGVPSGFVYHKISIPLPSNDNLGQITHTSVKLNDNDSFVYSDTIFDKWENSEIIWRKISEVGITYIMYPHIVLRIEHCHLYNIYDYSKNDSVITNGGINFEIGNNINSYNAVLVEIFIELDIRVLLDDVLNPFRTYTSSSEQNVWLWYDWFKETIIKCANETIRLNASLTDTLNKEYIKFIGANITKYNCYRGNDNTITCSKQENGEAYFNSNEKDKFLNELNKTGTPGDGNVFYNNDNIVNIYNSFHNDSTKDYRISGMFNYKDIENNINDTYEYPDGKTIEDYSSYLSADEDNITFLESVALSLMRYHELNKNNTNNYIKTYEVNDFSNDLKSLMTKLKNLDKAEDDILWGRGVTQLKDSIVSAYTFKKNKILLKVRK